MKVAIFGDTGGHYRALRQGLDALGVNGARIPSDLTVIHLGDLVHRGPNSDAVVLLVNNLMEENPGRWIQILGNHEAMHVGLAKPFFPCSCSSETIETLQQWWANGSMVAAAGVLSVAPRRWTTGNRPLDQESLVSNLLCVHGGLTHEFWRDELDSPATVEETVMALSVLPDSVLRREGLMTAGVEQAPVGPFWATATEETLASWLGHDMPFSQVVGHTAPYIHELNKWRFSLKHMNGFERKAVPEERRAVLFHETGVILCEDPGYGKEAPSHPQPSLVVEADFVI